MTTKAPTLAWLLTAASCFVVGLLVADGWRQAAAPPAPPTVGVDLAPMARSEPTPVPTTFKPRSPAASGRPPTTYVPLWDLSMATPTPTTAPASPEAPSSR